MPDITTYRRDDRPTEGFHTAFLPARVHRPVRLFLPSDYQPKYAYPLVVLLHADGADEDRAAVLAPQLSRRNYIVACPRGPVSLGVSPAGRPAFAWNDDQRADEYLSETVALACREYNIHSERIYLMGIDDSARAAYRWGLARAGVIAGVVAINGRLPKSFGRQRFHMSAKPSLRVFIGHGTSNPVVNLREARQAARRLNSAGADVEFATYPTANRVSAEMLRDVNRWIMDTVNGEADQLPPGISV